MNLLFLALVLSIIFILSLKFPGYGFILGLTIFFNIGGYFDRNAFGLPSFFSIMDVVLIFAFVVGIAEAIVEKDLKFDYNFKKLLLICLTFSLYQIFVTIWIKLGITNPVGFLKEIVYHKWRIFGILFAIPTYIVIQKFSKEIFRIIIAVTFIIITLFFISLLFSVNLIEIIRLERGMNVNVLRVSIRNYGYMILAIPMGLFVFLSRERIKSNKILGICALGMCITILITMTRITIFTLFGLILISIILLHKYFALTWSRTLFKGVVIILGSVLLTLLLFPGVLPALYNIFNLTFLEFRGVLPEGTTQTRTIYELDRMMSLFKQNFLIGTGYLRDYFAAYHTHYELGLADLPIIGNLAIYGIVGYILYLLRYIVILSVIKEVFNKHIKNSLVNHLSTVELVLLMGATANILALVFFRFIYFSKDLVYDWNMIEFGFLVGIIFGLAEKYRISVKELENIENTK